MRMHKRIFVYARKNLTEFERVIVFDECNIIPALVMALPKKTRVYLWFWNTIEAYRQSGIVLIQHLFKRCRIYSFDENDVARYGLNFNHQFYFMDSCNSIAPSKTKNSVMFFCGQDKGRFALLTKLKEDCGALLETDFWMVGDSGRDYPPSADFVKDAFLNYDEVVRRVRNCNVIVDIVKSNQVGITLRVLEAICFGKKLLSNNVSLIGTNIYKSGNVYVIGHDGRSLKTFLMSPISAYDDAIKRQYSYESWLEGFE